MPTGPSIEEYVFCCDPSKTGVDELTVYINAGDLVGDLAREGWQVRSIEMITGMKFRVCLWRKTPEGPRPLTLAIAQYTKKG